MYTFGTPEQSRWKAVSVNNAGGFRKAKYTGFAREIGTQFNVNTMLSGGASRAEWIETRVCPSSNSATLTLQAYDFALVMAETLT